MLPSFIHYLLTTALLVTLVTLPGCAPLETKAIYPELIYKSDVDDAHRSMTAARDITVDSAGHVYFFDYDDNRIHKIDPEGRLLTPPGSVTQRRTPRLSLWPRLRHAP